MASGGKGMAIVMLGAAAAAVLLLGGSKKASAAPAKPGPAPAPGPVPPVVPPVVPPPPEPVIAPPPSPKPVCKPEEIADFQRHFNETKARIEQIRYVEMPDLQRQMATQQQGADTNKSAYNGMEGQIGQLLGERQAAVAAGEDGRGAVADIDQTLSVLRSVSNGHKEQYNAFVRNIQDIDARMAALDNELQQRESELLTTQQQLAKCKVAA